MMMFAIILAASFNLSSKLGSFFTLPEWMPDEVDSCHTIGSDGFKGMNYFAVTNENNVYMFNSCAYNEDGEVVVEKRYAKSSSHPERKDGVWSNPVTCAMNSSYGSLYKETLVEGSESQTYDMYTYRTTYEKYDTYLVVVETGVVYYEWVVTSSDPEVIEYNANRLTTTVGANWYATMEALLEREYCMSAGKFYYDPVEGSGWVESRDGPRNRAAFWFHTSSYDPTAYSFEYTSPFTGDYAKDINSTDGSYRKIESRRLVEYNNILRAVLATYDFYDLIVDKEGWNNPYITKHVSSSLFKEHGMTDIPTMDWTESIFSNVWHTCAWPYARGTFKINGIEGEGFDTICHYVPEDLTFGIGCDFWAGHTGIYGAWVDNVYCWWGPNIDLTNMLGCAYAQKSNRRELITTNSFTFMNRSLSAIDLSYAGTGVLEAEKSVKRSYQHELYGNSENMSVGIVWGSTSHVPTTTDKVECPSLEPTVTMTCHVSTNELEAVDVSNLLLVSAATEGVSGHCGVSVASKISVSEEDMMAAMESCKDYWLSINGTNYMDIVWWDIDSISLGSSAGRIDLDPTISYPEEANVTFSVSQENDYSYERELPYSQLPSTNAYYPSPSVASSVSSTKMYGLSTMVTLEDEYTYTPYDSEDCAFLGHCAEYSHSASRSLRNSLKDEADACREKLADCYKDVAGYDFTDPDAMIPVNESKFSSMVSGLTLPKGTVLSLNKEELPNIYIIDPDTGKGAAVYWYSEPETNIWKVVSTGALTVDRVYSATVSESGGYSTKSGRDDWSGVTRTVGIVETKWDFDCMKRE